MRLAPVIDPHECQQDHPTKANHCPQGGSELCHYQLCPGFLSPFFGLS